MKLHCSINQLRTKQVQVTAEFLKLDLELLHNDAKKLAKPEFLQKSIAGKVPVLESKEGFVFETVAIQQYLSSFQAQLNLSGSSDFSKAQVLQWILYLQNDFEVPLEVLANLSAGQIPANEELKQKAKGDLSATLAVLDKHLKLRTVLVDHQITLADINLAVIVEKLLSLKEFKLETEFVDLFRHFSFVSQQAPFVSATQKIEKVDKQVQLQIQQNLQSQEKQKQQQSGASTATTDKKDQQKDKQQQPAQGKGEKKQQPAEQQQKEQQKAPQKQAEQQPKQAEQPKKDAHQVEGEVEDATDDDFAALDIRVGKIVECWKHPESENLYCEKIDIGEGSLREIGSGLQKFVPIDQMSGLVLVLANLKPRKLAGFNSNGMVLCASNGDHTKVELMRPHKDCKVGERVTLANYDKITQAYAPVLNPKKKELEKVLPHLKTDDKLNATFKGKLFQTTQGVIQCATLNNCKIG